MIRNIFGCIFITIFLGACGSQTLTNQVKKEPDSQSVSSEGNGSKSQLLNGDESAENGVDDASIKFSKAHRNVGRSLITINDDIQPLTIHIKKNHQPDISKLNIPLDNDPYNNDLWKRVSQGFSMGNEYEKLPIVQWHVDRILRSPNHFFNMSKRASIYLHFVVEEVEKRNMPLEMALLPFVESRYHPFAVAPSSAAGGLWQFTRWTGRFYGLDQNWWYDGRFDVYESTNAALNLLQDLHDRYGDWSLALAAYNWGMGNVDRSLLKSQNKGIKQKSYWSIRMPWETRNYVPKLMAYAYIIAHREKLKVSVYPIDNKRKIKPVEINKPYEMVHMADAAKVTLGNFRLLNPGFRRWAVKPNSKFQIMVPAEVATEFKKNIASFDKYKQLKWRSYIVQSGDNLYDLARYHGITVRTLKQVNRLRSNLIRIGQKLIIPVKTL